MQHFAVPLATIGAWLAVVSPHALAQTAFPESEPNSIKAEADLAVCMIAGDFLTGTTTGTTASAGNSAVTTADYFRIQTCALAPGLYEHRLTLTTATPTHSGSIRGLSQTGTAGVGGTATAGSDIAIQTLTGSAQEWYGFGNAADIIVRVTGSAVTTGAYTHTLSTTTLSPTVIGPFLAGTITITSAGQGHATDDEIVVFTGSGGQPAGFLNDDPWPGPNGVPATLTRTFAAGTYYVGLSDYNIADVRTAPNDEVWVTGPLLDFAGSATNSSVSAGLNVAFAVTDTAGTTPVAATKAGAFDIVWFRFDVVSPSPGTAYCDPGAGGVIACPCGNAPGGANRGCDNSLATGGASISGSGAASLGADTLVVSASGIGSTTGTCAGSTDTLTWILLQGSANNPAGLGFNDGVRCFDGALKRIESGTSVGGVATSTSSISAQSTALGDPIAASTSRYYGIWYRDPCGTFACAAPVNSNVSNGYSVLWLP